MIRRFAIFALVGLAVIALVSACGEATDDDESCPSFSDRQLLPEIGGGDTEYVLWVKLKSNKANRQLESIVCNAFYADGRSTGITLDMVRVEDEPYKYIRTFQGNEMCDSGACTLFFQVVATHEDGCRKQFDTPLFQVVIDAVTDDDDNNDDNDTTT